MAEKITPGEDELKSELMDKMTEVLLQISETRKEIQDSIVPKFIEISPRSKDIIELAVEIWRLENRLSKIYPSISESQKETLNGSVQKIKRYLDKNDVETIDYTNQKFNEGRNLDILAVEKDENIKESIIKETKEPTVMIKGQVVRRGKVIILTNEEQPKPEEKSD